MNKLGRRRFLGGAAMAGAGLLAMASCGEGKGGSSAEKNLQFTWWGNPERDKRTRAAIKAYEKKKPNVTIRPQISGWDGYWDKLATQTAGGSAPDVIQMDYAYITSYSKRGALLALDDFVPKKLQIGDFGKQALAPGQIDGKLYGANWGVNALAMMCNEAMLKAAGEDLPPKTLTWNDFADLVRRVGTKTPDGVFGTENGMLGDGIDTALQCWLRERGKDLYVDDGTRLAFEPDDMIEWFEFWQRLVKDGAAATPEFQLSLSGDLADGLVPTGKGAFQFAWSNQLTAFTEATKGGTVAIHTYPLGDGPDAKPGFYYNASMFLSVSAKADDPDAAVALVNALLTDPDVAGELGYERGVPPSHKVQQALLPHASQPEKDSADYIKALADTVTDAPIPAPDGDEKVREAYKYASEQAGYGKATNKAAVDKFFNDAQDALSS